MSILKKISSRSLSEISFDEKENIDTIKQQLIKEILSEKMQLKTQIEVETFDGVPINVTNGAWENKESNIYNWTNPLNALNLKRYASKIERYKSKRNNNFNHNELIDIRKLSDKGVSIKSISNQFNSSYQTIWNVINNHSYINN